MTNNNYLRALEYSDYKVIREIYVDAIENLGQAFYTKQQIHAWSGLAFLPGILDESLQSGKGWISSVDSNDEIAAFAVRYPLDRLALLYCRSIFTRQGHATGLLNHIKQEALQEGQKYLFTEASAFSFPLLKKHGWTLIVPEIIQIGGIDFKRYRMQLKLT